MNNTIENNTWRKRYKRTKRFDEEDRNYLHVTNWNSFVSEQFDDDDDDDDVFLRD